MLATRLLAVVFPLVALAAACGGSEDQAAPAGHGPAGGGGGPAGGSSGGAGAPGGAGGPAGGSSGSSGGKAGAGGGGGASGAGAAGGGAGASGGGAGASGGGAPAGGGSSGCSVDADCGKPITNPIGCAHGKCDVGTHSCSYLANDADGDGFPTNKCKSSEGKAIVVGTDCDDTDKAVFPGSWDGPKGDGNPDRCDSVDQDCDGTADDSALKSGGTCTCTPADVRACSQDSSGKPIAWPTGKPEGACKAGAQTCTAQGQWGPCTGAIEPKQESCNKIDDDCNGDVDDGPAPDGVPLDAVTFVYDGDADGHAGRASDGYDEVHACAYAKPQAAPTACTKLALPCALGATAAQCCPPGAWKLAAGVPQDDCDDRSPSVNPAQVELCNKLDDDCNGKVDDGPGPGGTPQDAKYFYYDGDGDGRAGTVAAGYTPVYACQYAAPIAAPAACTSLPLPCSLGTTVQECCADGRWKAGIPNDDCDDRASAVHPGAAETCGDGVDNDCNTKVDDSCSCTNGAPCGDPSTCNAGATWSGCGPGQSGNCSVLPQARNVYYKDADKDGYCDLSSKVEACPNETQPDTTLYRLATTCLPTTVSDCADTDPARSPGAKELCGDGVDTDCDGADSNGYDVGAVCNVKGKAAGACLAGGAIACSSAGSTMTWCAPVDSAIGHPSLCSTAPRNASWDVNCDGTDEPCCALGAACSKLGACPENLDEYCLTATVGCKGKFVCGDCGSGVAFTCSFDPQDTTCVAIPTTAGCR